MPSLYSRVKDLPEVLQKALAAVGYHREDISIEGRETISIHSCGAAGRRAFAMLVDLEKSTHMVTYGSWGGPNMFTSNHVDTDDRDHTIPVNGAVIKGYTGGGGIPAIANLYLHPSNVVRYLPAQVTLTDEEKDALRQLNTLKPAYRRIPGDVLTSLISRGLAKKNRAGAVQITTAGKSAWR
jgi:hypothetical protein